MEPGPALLGAHSGNLGHHQSRSCFKSCSKSLACSVSTNIEFCVISKTAETVF